MSKQEYVLGVDEAGRGPVLGPMVYGAVFCPMDKHDDLKKTYGVDDSKKLSATVRESIFAQLLNSNNNVDKTTSNHHLLKVLTPEYLSSSMLKKDKYNLNAISHDTVIELAKEAKRIIETELKGKLKEMYVDTVGPEKTFQAKLEKELPDVHITVAKKADSLYACVSAASIVAKVTRDRVVEELAAKHKATLGSGYPGDPLTKKYMDTVDYVFGYNAEVVRFSWKPSQVHMDEKGCKMEWSDDEEDADAQQPKLKSFLQPKRTEYFERQGMDIVSDF